jgi:hypothetical protein
MTTTIKSTACGVLAFLIAAVSSPAEKTQRHYVIAISSGLPVTQGQAVFAQSMQFLLYQAHPGDRVEFIAAPTGNRLADVVVPEGTARARANSREYAGKIGALKHYLGESGIGDARQVMQLRLPQLLDALARTRGTPDPITLIVVGLPLHVASNESEAAFDMEKGLTPGDGLVATSINTSLFGTKERQRQLENVVIHWLTPTDDWPVSDTHRHQVMRFWTVFLGAQGGVLSTFSADPARVFERAIRGEANAVLAATLDPNDRALVMRPPPVFRLEREAPVESRLEIPSITPPSKPTPVPVPQAVPNKPPLATSTPQPIVTPKTTETVTPVQETTDIAPVEIPLPQVPVVDSVSMTKAVAEIPRAPAGRIGIAVVWETPNGAAAAADVDLYVKARASFDEVYWRHAQGQGAVYFRDVRHAGPQRQGGDWTACWEYVEVKHVQPQDVSVWLNLYSARSAVSGIVRVQHGGRVVDQPFQFAVTRGNRGGDSSLAKRRESPFWQTINISELLAQGDLVKPNSVTR